jgi:PTH1 family peptidyl-tRNA hydrolase
VQATQTHLIIALGNPGAGYQFDRHNVGFMVGEELRRRHGLPALRSRFQGLVGEGTMVGQRVVLLLPMTFMNLSGKAAAEAARWYKIPVERMLVVHDEVELPFGEARLKEGQGLGGHNGLRSLEQFLGTRDFWRLRVGVGRPGDSRRPLADHVLEPFSEPREEVLALISRAADLAEEWLAARGGGACPA